MNAMEFPQSTLIIAALAILFVQSYHQATARKAQIDVFSRVAAKYQNDHDMIPVLMVNNADKLRGPLLVQLQGSNKEAADSSEDCFCLKRGTRPSPYAKYYVRSCLYPINEDTVSMIFYIYDYD
jgi:hypothetical protein